MQNTKETGANACLDGYLDARCMPFLFGAFLPPGIFSVDNSGGLNKHDPWLPHASLPRHFQQRSKHTEVCGLVNSLRGSQWLIHSLASSWTRQLKRLIRVRGQSLGWEHSDVSGIVLGSPQSFKTNSQCFRNFSFLVGIPVPSLHGKQMGKQWKQWQTFFLGLQNHCRLWLQPWN